MSCPYFCHASGECERPDCQRVEPCNEGNFLLGFKNAVYVMAPVYAVLLIWWLL